MNAHELLAAEILVSLHRLLRGKVNGAHDGGRHVGADSHGGEIEGPELLANLTKAREVAGVAAEVEAPIRAQHGPRGPEPRVGIPRAALGEVLGGCAEDAEPAVLDSAPPVELDHP